MFGEYQARALGLPHVSEGEALLAYATEWQSRLDAGWQMKARTAEWWDANGPPMIAYAQDPAARRTLGEPRPTRAAAPIYGMAAAATAAPVVVVLRSVAVGDLRSALLSPVRFAVDTIVPRSVATMLGGHGGTGKSTLALVIAAHVACGVPWCGLQCAQGRVVFVTLEDPAEVVRWRLRLIAEAYGLDANTIAQNVVILDGTDADSCALAHEAVSGGRATLEQTAAMRQVSESATGATLIVVDNASDAFDANENDRRQVRAFVRALAKIARDSGAGLLLLAHIDKQAARHGSAGNTYSGSTAWHNSARSRLALVESESGGLELRHEKANLSRKADPIRLRFNGDGVPVPLSAGAGAAFEHAHDADLLRCIASAIERGDSIGTGRAGPGNTHAHAKTLAGFPEALRPAGKFWPALGRLADSGAIVREDYTTPARKARQRWMVAPVAPIVGTVANPHIGAHPAPVVQGVRGNWSNSTTGASPDPSTEVGPDAATLH
ncbi:AAA family ATPase [Dokdonella sp.]|uniref:AAA family ATPase n=1 Tax=Dokdonella sp. TaxID=2291710 RepID=UPI003784A7C1